MGFVVDGVALSGFDPHTHYGGVIGYRSLALLVQPTASRPSMPASRDLVDVFLADEKFSSAVTTTLGVTPDIDVVRQFLAHHEVLVSDGAACDVVKVKPLRAGGPADGVQFSSAAAFQPGTGRRVVEVDALFRLEYVLMLRLLDAVLDTLEHAGPSMGGKADRVDHGSSILRVVQGMGRDLWDDAYDGVLADPLTILDADTDVAAAAKPVKHVLQHVLSASPLTDFDEAYVMRGLLASTVVFPSSPGPPIRDVVAFDRASSAEWASEGIAYAEVSAGADDIVSTVDSRRAAALASAGVEVGWLVQIPNTAVCEDVADDAADAADAAFRDRWVGALERALLGAPTAAGFSVLAPETFSYAAPRVRATLHRRLRMLLDAVVRHAAPDRRLVAHIHVGEGGPRWGNLDPENVRRLLLDKRATVDPAVDATAAERLRAMAKANVGAAISACSGHPATTSDDVAVRFGHVTHVGDDDASRMADLGIWADVNLTSNLATGALLLSDDALDVKWLDPSVFADHGIHRLVAQGVRFVLGTDGGGVEHCSHPTEYARLAAIDPSYLPIVAGHEAEYLAWIGKPAADPI